MVQENHWTKQEDKLLRQYYPQMGTSMVEFLPNRSKSAIEHRCRVLNVKYGLFEIGEEAYLDIETTNLRADFAYMVSWAIKVKGLDLVFSDVITKEEIFNEVFDKRIVESLINRLKTFKRVYGYYSTKFDIPFARTRALKWDIEFPPYGLIQHQDIYYLVKSKLCLSRNRLEAVCEFLGIKGKTKLEGGIWVRAAVGNKKCLEYILKHNIADVKILERAHKRIMKYAGIQKRSL